MKLIYFIKRFKNKALPVVLSLSVCSVSVVCPLITASADSLTGELLGHMVACEYSRWSEVSEAGKELAQAYVDLFKSTDLKGVFKSIEDIPISWLKMVGTTQYVLSPFPTVAYILNESGVLEVENSNSTHGGRHRVGDEHDDVVIGSDPVKKFIEDKDFIYYPLGPVSKVSWKTDKNFSNSSFDSERTRYYFTILEKHNFFGIDGLKEFYAVPFFEYGDELYFSNYCIYFNLGIQQINSSGELSLHTFDIGYVDILNTAADLKNTEVYKSLFNETIYSLAEESYIVSRINTNLYAAWYYNGFGTKAAFQKREDFFSSPGLVNAGGGFAFFKGFTPFKTLYNSKNSTLSVSDSVFYSYFTKGSLSEKVEDYGFYISETPIIMDCFGADIDTSKIPDNYYITVSGDTIYDYSITNPDTGQSSTINEYITNNYTYITNNNPSGDGSGSGTTGGNVTVGGNVGVNGNVNVGGEVKFGGEVSVGVDVSPIDINVNVSGNGGAGESGEKPPSYIDDKDVDLDSYIEKFPEVSKGFFDYLKGFFDWLPKEIYGLIVMAIVAAIWCRLAGR